MLVNGNEGVSDGTNETKVIEETKIDERSTTNNRVRQNEIKAKTEGKKDGNLEKIDLKNIYIFSTFRGETE